MALDVSHIGMDRAIARGIFKDLILDSGEKETNSPNFERLMETLGGAAKARNTGRQLPARAPVCPPARYADREQGLQPAPLLYTRGRGKRGRAGDVLPLAHDLPAQLRRLCLRAERAQCQHAHWHERHLRHGRGGRRQRRGRAGHALRQLPRVAMHRMPAEHGLFASWSACSCRRWTLLGPVTQFCSTNNGPGSFVDIMRYWRRVSTTGHVPRQVGSVREQHPYAIPACLPQ